MPHKHANSSNKQKGGIRLLWIPTGSRHKHKKNKYYLRDNYDSPKRAMMSGDSPNSHTKDYLDFKEGRSTPPPTTSKDALVQNSATEECKPEILAASVILEPLKNKEMCYIDVGDEHLPHKKNDDIITPEDKSLRSNLKDEGDRKGLNGMIDQIDGNLMPLPALEKEESDTENNNCVVNCLYYSLQCCECNIM